LRHVAPSHFFGETCPELPVSMPVLVEAEKRGGPLKKGLARTGKDRRETGYQDEINTRTTSEKPLAPFCGSADRSKLSSGAFQHCQIRR
jgi:hypothetical protein